MAQNFPPSDASTIYSPRSVAEARRHVRRQVDRDYRDRLQAMLDEQEAERPTDRCPPPEGPEHQAALDDTESMFAAVKDQREL
jgi:hypothetical protein